MRAWIRWAVSLYPAGWRRRYGDEFGALLEDIPPGWRSIFDVLKGALAMHIEFGRFFRIVSICGLAGLLISTALVLASPREYRATAVIVPPRQSHAAPGALVHGFQLAQQTAFSRASLAEIITRPSLDLYRSERARTPMFDVISRMQRDLRVTWREPSADRPRSALVEFSYPDARKARETVAAVTQKLVGEARTNSSGSDIFQFVELQVVREHAGWQTFLHLSIGLLGGAALGALIAWLAAHSRRRRWNIGLLSFAGAAAGLTVAFLIPDQFVSTATLRLADSSELSEILDNKDLAIVVSHAHLYESVLPEKAVPILRRNLTIRELPPAGSHAYQIELRYPDRFKAQAALQTLLGWKIERRAALQPGSPQLDEVIDPPTLPVTPVSPNRALIPCTGVVAALIGGAWRRRSLLPQGVPAHA